MLDLLQSSMRSQQCANRARMPMPGEEDLESSRVATVLADVGIALDAAATVLARIVDNPGAADRWPVCLLQVCAERAARIQNRQASLFAVEYCVHGLLALRRRKIEIVDPIVRRMKEEHDAGSRKLFVEDLQYPGNFAVIHGIDGADDGVPAVEIAGIAQHAIDGNTT